MSFLTEVITRRVPLASRAAVSIQAPRQFSTSLAARKSVTEAAKDTLKTVDRKVSDKLVDTINAGSKAAEKVSGKTTEASYKAAGTAEEIRSKAKAEASELKGETEELKGKAKAAAFEAEGKVKGVAKETEGKVKGAMQRLVYNMHGKADTVQGGRPSLRFPT
ncbi:hypothetical protein F5Y17DRAFT_454949 [Xylariaceae sp. FL0594]|nr:hypothetical protein F5Y17DRAFT_454949 [Xylariaceae sp. FL0594]